ncbi:MAG TPA: DPP IV N-terminal domain-containing protein [Ohtaekwangia sp.]|nr:DPP IV N-terminal domain-containing protein [Ohtaekwangia sp.]
MEKYPPIKTVWLVIILAISTATAYGQAIKWSADGNTYYRIEQNEIVQYTLPSNDKKVFISKRQLTPAGQNTPLKVSLFAFSDDSRKVLIFTNTQRVWRINTRGDYWVLNLADNSLKKLGSSRPEASLMFAKFSPDGNKVAYVSDYNVYVEDLATNNIKALTTDGNRKFINGTFDWVYEEEFACRDGIRWSNDSRSIAYWQIDARDTRDYYMVNFTDSVYSQVTPVEYPKVGQSPSGCRIGIADIATAKTTWMNIPGDPRQHYIMRMEYIPGTNDLLLQQLNRKQNESKLIRCQPSGNATIIYQESDPAWIDVYSPAVAENSYALDFRHTFEWLAGGKEFLWSSEKDGWRHLYRVSNDGTKEMLVTPGDFDVIGLKAIDEKSGTVYFLASPDNATQRYLYSMKLNGKGKPGRVTPAGLNGTHHYNISPTAKYAQHNFSNSFTKPVGELITLPGHTAVIEKESIAAKLPKVQAENHTEFFKVKTASGIEMDGWMVKPANFDASKKYPVVFYVYTEPWGQEVTDQYGSSTNFLYAGDMRADGYIYIALDNRGTPVPKGAAWRKSIYRKIGIVNIQDQAEAAKEILKWPFVDAERIAVWGWSGGGSATLNLMFQYPDIYKTGIAIAAVSNQLTYDNIYQERYMGLPQENMDDFIKGSPLTYAKNLKGNLLYIHGTGDDNVHYQNAEMLVNELIKHNKQFQFMPYPNRTHGISEGEGTFEHLSTLYTEYLKKHCPPGAK